MAAEKSPIWAAGAVVFRETPTGREYLLVHRDYRQDWTFPKGKLDPGEHVLAAAIREVREETGFAVQLSVPLPTLEYSVNGRRKIVDYWLGQIVAGEFVANSEVDEIRWADFKKAKKLLTYERDLEVLEAAAQAKISLPLVVLRHTQAMKRAEWRVSGNPTSAIDSTRPLTPVGRTQANGTVAALAAYAVTSIHSSDSRRCRDTVGPYASARSLGIWLEESVSEENHQIDPARAAKRILELASMPQSLVLCTHRPVLPTVMAAFAQRFGPYWTDSLDPALTPGSMLVLHRDPANLDALLAIERLVR